MEPPHGARPPLVRSRWQAFYSSAAPGRLPFVAPLPRHSVSRLGEGRGRAVAMTTRRRHGRAQRGFARRRRRAGAHERGGEVLAPAELDGRSSVPVARLLSQGARSCKHSLSRGLRQCPSSAQLAAVRAGLALAALPQELLGAEIERVLELSGLPRLGFVSILVAARETSLAAAFAKMAQGHAIVHPVPEAGRAAAP